MKKIFIGIFGFTVLGVGIAMIVLPGPAFIFIPLGIAILASEFIWAKRILQKTKKKLNIEIKVHPDDRSLMGRIKRYILKTLEED